MSSTVLQAYVERQHDGVAGVAGLVARLRTARPPAEGFDLLDAGVSTCSCCSKL
jgi:hypothetical protein